MSLWFALSHGALWILVILQGLVLLGLVRLVHQLRQGVAIASQPPPDGERLAGQRAPELTAVDVRGAPVSGDDFAGRTWALLFVSPRCSECVVTLEELEALQRKVDGNVAVVCMAGTDECRRMVDDYGLSVPVVADPDEQLSERFDIAAPPTAVLISAGGHVMQYGHPGRDEELEQVLRLQDEAAPSAGAR